MTTTTRRDTVPEQNTTETREQAAARHLYEAEVALHIAHQSHVDAWIAAAGDKLHRAVLEHAAATHRDDTTGRTPRQAHPAIETDEQ